MRDLNRRLPVPLLALALGLLIGCTSHSNYRQGETASQLGHWDEAVLSYMKAVDGDPTNISYQAALLRAKIKASQEHFEKGQAVREGGGDRAGAGRVPAGRAARPHQPVRHRPSSSTCATPTSTSPRSEHGARDDRRDEAGTRGSARRSRRCSIRARTQPISLEFPQPVSIFEIYRALGKAFGINILFDPNLQGPGDRDRA